MVVYSNIGNERRENGEDKLKEEGMDGYFLLVQYNLLKVFLYNQLFWPTRILSPN